MLKNNKKIRQTYNGLIETSIQKEKKIEFFDFWCEPLIPLYISNNIEKNDNVIIVYLRLNSSKFDYEELLSTLLTKCRKFSNYEVLAIFNGFGIFDLILIIKFDSYLLIPQIVNNIRSCFEDCLYDSCSLICAPYHIELDKDKKITFSIIIKITAWAEKTCVWSDIEYIAKEIGISRVCVEEINNNYMGVTYKQGFFDIIFIGHGTLQHFSDFCRILESFPFVIDTSTMLNLKIDCGNGTGINAFSTI